MSDALASGTGLSTASQQPAIPSANEFALTTDKVVAALVSPFGTESTFSEDWEDLDNPPERLHRTARILGTRSKTRRERRTLALMGPCTREATDRASTDPAPSRTRVLARLTGRALPRDDTPCRFPSEIEGKCMAAPPAMDKRHERQGGAVCGGSSTATCHWIRASRGRK